jgi:hypothetical protein
LGVKAAGAWSWRPHQLHVPNVMKIWGPKPPGTFWATPGLLWDSFTFTFTTTTTTATYHLYAITYLKETTFLGYRSVILTVILRLQFMVHAVLFSMVNFCAFTFSLLEVCVHCPILRCLCS